MSAVSVLRVCLLVEATYFSYVVAGVVVVVVVVVAGVVVVVVFRCEVFRTTTFEEKNIYPSRSNETTTVACT